MNLKETQFIHKMEENFLKDQFSIERFEMCPKNKTRERKKKRHHSRRSSCKFKTQKFAEI